MFVIHRSHLVSKLALVTAAAGAAAITGLTQAAASDLPAFSCTDKSGGTSGVTGTVTRVETAHHDGYDRLVIGFATSLAVPAYEVHRQASSTFTRDASGQSVSLEGSAGIRIVLRGSDIADGVPGDLKPRLPEIREVANIGDFERVVSYGAGLTDQACIRVVQLANPSRLVIDVQTPTGPAASTATTNQAVAASANSGTSVSNLATTGLHSNPFPSGRGGVLITLFGLAVIAAGLTLASLRRFARK